MHLDRKTHNRYRYLYLVRHGDYVTTASQPGGELTNLGIAQARHMAGFFARSGIELDRVWCSTLSRAEQTARIVCTEAYPDLEPRRTHLLRERLFPAPEYDEPAPGYADKSMRNLAGIEKRWLRPSRSERHELLVCHGNVIRAIVTRAIGGPVHCWCHMIVCHCSVTEIVCYDHDFVRLAGFNGHAFFPPELVTI